MVTAIPMTSNKIQIRDLSVSYDGVAALRNVTIDVPRNKVFSIIGPSNSGKTTLLKAINRTLEFTPGVSVKGQVLVDDEDTSRMWNVYELRRRIGMVFPLPVGLPLSVYDNVAYAPRRAGVNDRGILDEIVERCLTQAALWDEVKDRMKSLGTMLSGGQQQRLTLARALSHSPEILCLDEFSIAIDPVTTMRIEDVLIHLKENMTIILVTNLVQQARRLGDMTCFMNKGAVVEWGPTEKMFSDNPDSRLTFDYIHGVFG